MRTFRIFAFLMAYFLVSFAPAHAVQLKRMTRYEATWDQALTETVDRFNRLAQNFEVSGAKNLQDYFLKLDRAVDARYIPKLFSPIKPVEKAPRMRRSLVSASALELYLPSAKNGEVIALIEFGLNPARDGEETVTIYFGPDKQFTLQKNTPQRWSLEGMHSEMNAGFDKMGLKRNSAQKIFEKLLRVVTALEIVATANALPGNNEQGKFGIKFSSETAKWIGYGKWALAGVGLAFLGKYLIDKWQNRNNKKNSVKSEGRESDGASGTKLHPGEPEKEVKVPEEQATPKNGEAPKTTGAGMVADGSPALPPVPQPAGEPKTDTPKAPAASVGTPPPTPTSGEVGKKNDFPTDRKGQEALYAADLICGAEGSVKPKDAANFRALFVPKPAGATPVTTPSSPFKYKINNQDIFVADTAALGSDLTSCRDGIKNLMSVDDTNFKFEILSGDGKVQSTFNKAQFVNYLKYIKGADLDYHVHVEKSNKLLSHRDPALAAEGLRYTKQEEARGDLYRLPPRYAQVRVESEEAAKVRTQLRSISDEKQRWVYVGQLKKAVNADIAKGKDAKFGFTAHETTKAISEKAYYELLFGPSGSSLNFKVAEQTVRAVKAEGERLKPLPMEPVINYPIQSFLPAIAANPYKPAATPATPAVAPATVPPGQSVAIVPPPSTNR